LIIGGVQGRLQSDLKNLANRTGVLAMQHANSA
jgi:hypothetical protein